MKIKQHLHFYSHNMLRAVVTVLRFIALLMNQRAVSEKGFHYHGGAGFFLPNGDALARSLVGLMAK